MRSLAADFEVKNNMQKIDEGVLGISTHGKAERKQIRNKEKVSCDAVSVEATADPAEISEVLMSFGLEPP